MDWMVLAQNYGSRRYRRVDTIVSPAVFVAEIVLFAAVVGFGVYLYRQVRAR